MKGGFRLRIDPLAAVAVAYLLIVERSVWGMLSLTAAALHEGGHLLAACLLHVRPSRMTIGAFGARIGLDDYLLSYRDEACIAAAGPAVNLLSAAAALLSLHLRGGGDERLLFFAAASLALAAVNLLPMRTFDGGRVLGCLSALLMGERAAGQILRWTTAACTIALWSGAVALWFSTGGNLSLLVLAVLLLWRVVAENARVK